MQLGFQLRIGYKINEIIVVTHKVPEKNKKVNVHLILKI